MFDQASFGLSDSIFQKICQDDEDCHRYFGEITSYLHAPDFDALIRDLRALNETGELTPLIRDIVRRARIMADADRICERLGNIHMPKRRR